MVTEKNSGSTHVFLKDPIRLLVDGDWLTADGTTLGADNGIGVSAALALLDRKTLDRPCSAPHSQKYTRNKVNRSRSFFDVGGFVAGRMRAAIEQTEGLASQDEEFPG